MTFTFNTDERTILMNEGLKIAEMIKNTTDPVALSALRADYREIEDKLAAYYDDEPKEIN